MNIIAMHLNLEAKLKHINGDVVTESGILYVLTRGQVDDLAAYMGPSGWGADRVARSGAKIGEYEARKIFADETAGKEYRR